MNKTLHTPRCDAEVIKEFEDRFISIPTNYTARMTDWLKTLLAERPLPPQATDKRAKIEAGAKDFAERFAPTMKELAEEEATDKGCCKNCLAGGASGYNPVACTNANCHCHSTTPSWELQLRDSLQNEWGTDYRVSDSFDNWIVEKVATLLSQTLSNERQRMVAIGEGLRKPTSDEDEWGIAVMKQYFNEAITTYQQKINSLNS